MLAVGDVHVFVHDFDKALEFWVQGLGLELVEKETTEATQFALLEFPAGGPALRLFGGAQPWQPDERPPLGLRPTIRFDLMTDEFDDVLVKALDHGGRQVEEIETYSGCRVVTICDPDGNTFELVEVPDQDEATEPEHEGS